jgi:hypothetical protein
MNNNLLGMVGHDIAEILLKAAINTINLLGIVVRGPLQGKLSDLLFL